ncbi:MAG: ATP-binding protein [Treponema sp.]|jgi:predicted AAA+ superfamily ATPase|nr:ATP-binding protein [Treponema sp.]
MFTRPAYTERLRGFIDKPLIKVITGIRRCGKSTLLLLFQEAVLEHTDKNHTIFMNFEDAAFDSILDYRNLNDYLAAKMTGDGRYYIFLDEIQIVEQWEKSVNSLRLKNTDIYITGSNSRLLSSELATLLAGRYVAFHLHTLSFAEFIDFRRQSGLSLTGAAKAGGIADAGGELDTFIETGGFPVLSANSFSPQEARQIVMDINSSAVLRDVVQRNGVRNTQLLEKIIAFLYDNTGNPLSIKRISDYLKTQKRNADFETVYNYISYLESAFIIYRAPRYDIKGKRLLETTEKYYLADHSLQYAVRGIRQENIGGILENIVFMELIRRSYRVYVGKLDTREIDFVAEKINGPGRLYVQVTVSYANPETREREFSPLRAIKDHWPKMVVSLDKWQSEEQGVTGIHLKDFLLKPESTSSP